MPDQEVGCPVGVFAQPDVGFHARAACSEGVVEGHLSGVVIVGMAWLGEDVSTEVLWPGVRPVREVGGFGPGLDDLL